MQRFPNAADLHVFYALLLNMRGRGEDGLAMMERAMRLCPVFPDFYLGIVAISYRLLGRFDEAIAADLNRLAQNPENGFAHIRLAATYAEISDPERARHHIEQTLKRQPHYRLRHVSQTDPYENPQLMKQYEDLLRTAGLPA